MMNTPEFTSFWGPHSVAGAAHPPAWMLGLYAPLLISLDEGRSIPAVAILEQPGPNPKTPAILLVRGDTPVPPAFAAAPCGMKPNEDNTRMYFFTMPDYPYQARYGPSCTSIRGFTQCAAASACEKECDPSCMNFNGFTLYVAGHDRPILIPRKFTGGTTVPSFSWQSIWSYGFEGYLFDVEKHPIAKE